MKTAILILLISPLLAVSVSFAQENPLNIKFYVNNGNTEVKELTCYDFDNLMIKYDNVDGLTKYDAIFYIANIWTPTSTSPVDYETGIETRLLIPKYDGKSRIESYLFKKPGENAGIYSSNAPIKRSDLQRTVDAKDLEGSYLIVKVAGAVVTSYEETYNAASGTFTREPRYKYDVISVSEKLPLKNRLKISMLVYQATRGVVDYVKDPNCYVYSGTPTESADQTATATKSSGSTQGTHTTQSEIRGETDPAEKKVNAAEPVDAAAYQKSIEDGIVDGPFTKTKSDGRKELEGNYMNKKKNGVFKYYNNAGTVVIKEEPYVNDVIHGTLTEYHSNGQKSSVMTVVNGVADGPATTYDEQGKMTGTGVMKNNQPESLWKFYRNGVLNVERNFVNGKWNGVSTTYHPNGKVSETTTFENGKETGAYKSYSDKGILKSEGNYTKGKKNGVWKSYDSAGKLTKEEVYVDGVLKAN